jgi:hypothetical protein
MNSFQQKLEEARALLSQHNSQIPADSKVGRVEVESFFTNLSTNGGTSEQALSQCTWEDLQSFGCSPKLLARQVANIFRAKEDKKEEKPFFKKSKVEAMTVGELISHYDPRTPTSLVTGRLQALMDDKRFIVFNPDGSVNAEVSTKLAQELLDDYPEREHYLLNGDPTKTYRIGERPDQSFDENPLYHGRVLRPDGDCDQTNRSWSGVALEVKQVLYLAVKSGEVKINSVNDAHNIIDLIVGKTDVEAIKTVRTRFTKAASALKEMWRQGCAPTLKIFKKVAEGKQNNPFGVNRTY